MILFNIISLFNWNWGVLGAAFMFLVFLGLIVVLIIFMRSGKKNN
ncbi:hypothetical protein [Lutibacter sp. B1]|nr:hypothetical protein [Lutibacter sp. B1]